MAAIILKDKTEKTRWNLLPNKLAILREFYTLPQSKMGLIFGYGENTWGNWERGANEIKISALINIADTVGLWVDYFIYDLYSLENFKWLVEHYCSKHKTYILEEEKKNGNAQVSESHPRRRRTEGRGI